MATACTLALRPHIKWSAIVPAPLRLLDEFCHRRLFQQLALVAHAERRLVRNLGIGQAPPPHQFCRDRRSLPAELSPRRAAGRAPRLRLGVARGGRGHAAGGTLCRTREEASCPLYFTRRAARFPILLFLHSRRSPCRPTLPRPLKKRSQFRRRWWPRRPRPRRPSRRQRCRRLSLGRARSSVVLWSGPLPGRSSSSRFTPRKGEERCSPFSPWLPEFMVFCSASETLPRYTP